ncbi:MAG: ABC transporter ATP-binding protein [Sphaerochaeta sp.]|nr:ABC transporter ATP-binding protein [Sphaerochaeta sp.]
MSDQKDNPVVPHLELRAVSKTFVGARNTKITAVDTFSLTVQKGEAITIIGPSGCGKSTTLRMIGGFLAPDSGEILLHGVSLTGKGPEERTIPMVFQNYALFPHMNVFENIAYGLKSRKKPMDSIHHDVAMMCQMLNLVGTEERFPHQLSDGQQQRVALARALVLKPELLLFDEPLSNLDARLRLQTRREIKKMQKLLGITTIYVTHDQSEALSMPDRVVVMNRGSIIQVGSPREVYNNPRTPFVADFISNANFYEGEILEFSYESVIVSVNNLEFSVLPEQCDAVYQKGDGVYVAILPQSVTLSSYYPPENSHQVVGEIEALSFNGYSIEYEITFQETFIRVVAPHNFTFVDEYLVKEKVLMHFHPSSFHLFTTKES